MTSKKQKNSYRAAKEAYGEVKRRFNVTLTQSVVNFLDEKADDLGLSRSELMERIFRSMILEDDCLNWHFFTDQQRKTIAGDKTSAILHSAVKRCENTVPPEKRLSFLYQKAAN